jgi:hypothetical protein
MREAVRVDTPDLETGVQSHARDHGGRNGGPSVADTVRRLQDALDRAYELAADREALTEHISAACGQLWARYDP